MRRIGRGLYARTPWLAVAFVFAAVASLGLPGLAGFWGELLSLRAAYEVGDVLGQAVRLDRSSASRCWASRSPRRTSSARSACSPRASRCAHEADRDLTLREIGRRLALVASIVVLGLAPGLIVGLYDFQRTFATVTR